MSLLGDARAGKLADNVVGFARTLRRAGLPIDPSRIVLAQQALMQISLREKNDVEAALECIFLKTETDRPLFREIFKAYFKDPEIANKLLAQLLPQSQGKAQNRQQRARVFEALAPQNRRDPLRESGETKVQFDATLTSSHQEKLRNADFNQLSTAEFLLVEQLVQRLRLKLPEYASRNTRLSRHGYDPDWRAYFKELARLGEDALPEQMRQRVMRPTPLVVLIDISGSMERYARMMLTFLHAATKHHHRRAVFAFGTQLTNLGPAFAKGDPDLMLAEASRLIGDFAGGTRLGESLAILGNSQRRLFVGRRTTVLLVTDGLDTGDVQQLETQLSWLKRHSGTILWFNPLLRYDGYQPSAAGPARINAICDHHVAIHDLNSIEKLALGFSELCRKARA